MAQYTSSAKSSLGALVPSPTTPVFPSTSVDSTPQSNQHKRVYQACIPCRRRKVRCDLGSVDNPHDPPCVRCRRESKHCFFSATRRKRKGDDGADVSDEQDVDDYTIRNGRKRPHTSGSPPAHLNPRLYSDVPLTPGGSLGRSEPLRRPEGSHRGDFSGGEDSNAQLANLEAQEVMRGRVYGPHDALDLLYKAATNSPAQNPKQTEIAASTHPAPSQPLPHTGTGVPHSRPRTGPHFDGRNVKMEAAIDPALMKRDLSTEPGYAEGLRAWSRFRFVRAGWFTPQEAIEYIDYYYEYLSPLTPISPPTFRSPASHLTLLTEEPILTVTLLTIASRYKKMRATGAHCRSHAIHEQLWTYLRGMIERCLWGQEAFGGGFCATTTSSNDEVLTSSTAPWRGLRKGSLRTLGSIESLMILTEWHPRALHFPPTEATDELMLPSYDGNDLISTDEDGNQRPAGAVGGRRIESWLEPAWRSDRMCWMLLSTAMGLAYELGVFDDIDELLRDGAIARPEYEEETYRQRASRIKRLVLIYLTQLAGRLGWTNMVPESLRKSDPAVSRRRPVSVEGTTPATNHSSMSNAFNYVPDLELDDQIIHCWAGISNAMHIGNEKLFKSRKHTTEIIQNGKYIDLLKDFQPMLRDWWKEFERFPLPPYIRHILTIEYEYVRIYIYSLSLQAVVERCTSNAGNNAAGGSNAGSTVQLSPQTQNYYGQLPLGRLGGFGAADQEYIKEVVEGCRSLLKTVVEGLLPGDYLKHAPVRTYFRIISGAMFLLKTFALGAPRSDVMRSIDLMDATVEALRNCVVDDVHLGIRFADLLESLTSRLRNKFIQAPTLQHAASTDGRSPNPNHFDAPGMNGASVPKGQVNGADPWANHAAKLRDGLDGQDAPSPSAANISATPFDFSHGTFPYPSGSASVLNPSTPAAMDNTMIEPNIYDDWNNPGNEMWYLPPGPAFFQNMENNNVAMTAEGVNVGGIDLLEYMAMDTPFQSLDTNSYP